MLLSPVSLHQFSHSLLDERPGLIGRHLEASQILMVRIGAKISHAVGVGVKAPVPQ